MCSLQGDRVSSFKGKMVCRVWMYRNTDLAAVGVRREKKKKEYRKMYL